jgi:hypothetical protein
VWVPVKWTALCHKVAFAYEERLFDVYTLSDGQCVRKQQFRERSEALDAAGLG